MKKYECAFYEWHGSAASMRNLPGLADMLNKHASQGWELNDIKPVSIGFLVIFEQAVIVDPPKAAEPVSREPDAPL